MRTGEIRVERVQAMELSTNESIYKNYDLLKVETSGIIGDGQNLQFSRLNYEIYRTKSWALFD